MRRSPRTSLLDDLPGNSPRRGLFYQFAYFDYGTVARIRHYLTMRRQERYRHHVISFHIPTALGPGYHISVSSDDRPDLLWKVFGFYPSLEAARLEARSYIDKMLEQSPKNSA